MLTPWRFPLQWPLRRHAFQLALLAAVQSVRLRHAGARPGRVPSREARSEVARGDRLDGRLDSAGGLLRGAHLLLRAYHRGRTRPGELSTFAGVRYRLPDRTLAQRR